MKAILKWKLDSGQMAEDFDGGGGGDLVRVPPPAAPTAAAAASLQPQKVSSGLPSVKRFFRGSLQDDEYFRPRALSSPPGSTSGCGGGGGFGFSASSPFPGQWQAVIGCSIARWVSCSRWLSRHPRRLGCCRYYLVIARNTLLDTYG